MEGLSVVSSQSASYTWSKPACFPRTDAAAEEGELYHKQHHAH